MEVFFRSAERIHDRWEILVDGEKWREVHRSIFGKKPLFPSISQETDLQQIFDEYEYRRVKGYVLWRLSTQPYHSEQLKKMLSDRCVQSHTIYRVIQEYSEIGCLDDENWVSTFIRSHLKRYSLPLILRKLRAKGLSEETVRSIASQWKNPESELETIQQLLCTRYRSKDLSDYKTRQKVIASLARKGFGFDQIQRGIKDINDKRQ